MDEFSKTEIDKILIYTDSENNILNNLKKSTNIYRKNIIKIMKTVLTTYLNTIENNIQIFYLAVSLFDIIDFKKKMNLTSEDNQNLIAKCCIILSIKFIGNFDMNIRKIIKRIISSLCFYYNKFEINCLSILDNSLAHSTPFDILLILLNVVKNANNSKYFTEKNYQKLLNYSKNLLYTLVENNAYPSYRPMLTTVAVIKYACEHLGIYNSILDSYLKHYYKHKKVREIISLLNNKEEPESDEPSNEYNELQKDDVKEIKKEIKDIAQKSPSTNNSSPSEISEKMPQNDNEYFHSTIQSINSINSKYYYSVNDKITNKIVLGYNKNKITKNCKPETSISNYSITSLSSLNTLRQSLPQKTESKYESIREKMRSINNLSYRNDHRKSVKSIKNIHDISECLNNLNESNMQKNLCEFNNSNRKEQTNYAYCSNKNMCTMANYASKGNDNEDYVIFSRKKLIPCSDGKSNNMIYQKKKLLSNFSNVNQQVFNTIEKKKFEDIKRNNSIQFNLRKNYKDLHSLINSKIDINLNQIPDVKYNKPIKMQFENEEDL